MMTNTLFVTFVSYVLIAGIILLTIGLPFLLLTYWKMKPPSQLFDFVVVVVVFCKFFFFYGSLLQLNYTISAVVIFILPLKPYHVVFCQFCARVHHVYLSPSVDSIFNDNAS